MGAIGLCLVSGVLLFLAPAIWGYGGPAWVNDRACGVLIVAVASLALWPAGRCCRWGLVAIGAWLLVAPWLLIAQRPAAILIDLVTGLACLLLPLAIGCPQRAPGSGRASATPKSP